MGTKTVDRVVTYAAKLGINYLTLYTFSSENWGRPKTEVLFLMRLVKRFLAKELTKMMASGIRLRAIGDLERLPKVVLETLHEAISATQHNRGLTLILALSYGGRQDISQAVTKAIQFPPSNGFESLLWTNEVPDPDLLIRTGGEVRISNFLLWQMAYTELSFTPTLWPDFTNEELTDIIYQYGKRDRRFGGVHDAS